MSALPESGHLPPDLVARAAQTAQVTPFIVDGAVEAALWPGGPDEHQPGWRQDASCRGAYIMFPGRGEPEEFQKAMCNHCPVQASCLADALVNRERFGVWGGTSEKGRRALRKLLRGAGVRLALRPVRRAAA